MTYTVSVNRGVTADYGWKAADDLDGLIAAENGFPVGIWSDGTTVWVTDRLTDHKFYAYSPCCRRTRQTDRGVQPSRGQRCTLTVSGPTARPSGWLDVTDNKLCLCVSPRRRDPADRPMSIGLALRTTQTPAGIWSDGTTVWVADGADDKLYAYLLDGGTRQAEAEFDVDTTSFSNGIWSDGATVWVSDESKLLAYELDGGARQSGRDFGTLKPTGNAAPVGPWSDGATIWVVDSDDGKVYSYDMPPSADVRLSELSLSGVTLDPEFDAGTTTFTASVLNGVSSTM